MTDNDQLARAKTHEVIEAAKKSHAADSSLSFVQHLEMAARDLCRPVDEWQWSTSVRHDVWDIDIEAVVVGRAATGETGDLL